MCDLRNLSSIPVYIEEDHDQVLPHILRCIGAKHLPLDGNVMIHFDSHPDMLLPRNLKDSDCQNKYTLFEKLGIENWILPAAYLGAIDTIMWVCPPWSNQIRTGAHTFKVGKKISSENILVTSTEPYFLSETIVCRPWELENAKDVRLFVYKMGDESKEQADVLYALKNVLQERSRCILDIDLDFFSTKNPFIEMYSKIDLYQRLKNIYTFDSPSLNESNSTESTSIERLECAMQSCLKRQQLLDNLEGITNYLQNHGNLNSYSGKGIEFVQEFKEIHRDIKSVYGPDEMIDWNLVHNAGCTCDYCDLPHHPSTLEEIRKLIEDMKIFLKTLMDPRTSNVLYPTIVTVARSSLDDYCPSDQVDMIQCLVEDALKECFDTNLRIKFHRGYLNC